MVKYVQGQKVRLINTIRGDFGALGYELDPKNREYVFTIAVSCPNESSAVQILDPAGNTYPGGGWGQDRFAPYREPVGPFIVVKMGEGGRMRVHTTIPLATLDEAAETAKRLAPYVLGTEVCVYSLGAKLQRVTMPKPVQPELIVEKF